MRVGPPTGLPAVRRTIAGVTPDQMLEVLELILQKIPPHGPIMGHNLTFYDVGRVDTLWIKADFPIEVALIDYGIGDDRKTYRDIYHIEGQGWYYQLEFSPDLKYPEGMDQPPLPAMVKMFEGDEAAFSRDLVHARLLLSE